MPTATTRTTVSNGAPAVFDAVVPAPSGGDTARVNELTISYGGHVAFAPSPTPGLLIVHGSALSLNGGQLNLGEGTIVFLNDVVLNNGGSLDGGSGTLEFRGDVSAASGSSFDPGTSTVILSGSADQGISGELAFYDLVVETDGQLTISGSLTVAGSVFVDSGATLIVASGTTFTYEGTIEGGGTFVDQNELPVQMTALTAIPAAAGVTLQWSTATETNNDRFVIERRMIVEGALPAGFSVVGSVPGHGTSTSPRDYVYIDGPVATGRYVYRVTSIDRDGTSHRTLEVEAVVSAPERPGLDANYPNPFNPATKIGFRVVETGWVKVAMYDLAGRELSVLVDGVVPAGQHEVRWDAEAHPSAVYVCRMVSRGNVSARTVVLAR